MSAISSSATSRFPDARHPTADARTTARPMSPAVNLSGEWILASLVVGSLGGGLFLYGKKQSRWPQLSAGILLLLDSGAVPSAPWMCAGAGVVLLGVWLALRAGL